MAAEAAVAVTVAVVDRESTRAATRKLAQAAAGAQLGPFSARPWTRVSIPLCTLSSLGCTKAGTSTRSLSHAAPCAPWSRSSGAWATRAASASLSSPLGYGCALMRPRPPRPLPVAQRRRLRSRAHGSSSRRRRSASTGTRSASNRLSRSTKHCCCTWEGAAACLTRRRCAPSSCCVRRTLRADRHCCPRLQPTLQSSAHSSVK